MKTGRAWGLKNKVDKCWLQLWRCCGWSVAAAETWSVAVKERRVRSFAREVHGRSVRETDKHKRGFLS